MICCTNWSSTDSTGRMKYWSRSGKSARAWLELSTGSQPSLTPTQTWSSSASQKLGSASPMNEPTVTTWSGSEYCRVAERIPTGIAIARARNSEMPWSWIVPHIRSVMSCRTGSLLKL